MAAKCLRWVTTEYSAKPLKGKDGIREVSLGTTSAIVLVVILSVPCFDAVRVAIDQSEP